MTVKQLRDICATLHDDCKVILLDGPEEESDSYVDADATLAFSPERGNYLLIDRVW